MGQNLSNECKLRRKEACKERYRSDPDRFKLNSQRHRERTKLAILTHYSPNKTLGCSWKDCDVTDIDILTLDHIHDDGAADRRSKTQGWAGGPFYQALKTLGLPEGYQTLCCNHNQKKRVTALRCK